MRIVDTEIPREQNRWGIFVSEARMNAKLRTFLEAPHHRALSGAWLSGIDEMFHRGQITDRQHTAAIMFIRRADYRGPLRLPTERILMRGMTAESVADPRVGRTKGIDEVMCGFRGDLHVMANFYGVGRRCTKTDRRSHLRTLRARHLMKLQLERARRIRRDFACMKKTGVDPEDD
jgi:hypothetical protein